MISFKRLPALSRDVPIDHITGFIPMWIDETDSRPAAKQLHDHYQHGGGWQPFTGFTLKDNNTLTYPGDPPTRPLVEAKFRDELIVMYNYAWVAIIQPDRTFEVCRMD